MRHPLIPHARDRLLRLTAALVQLKARVREAVATELGRLVGEAVTDVLAAAVRGRPADPPPPPPHRAYRPAAADRWDDDADPQAWDDPADDDPAEAPPTPSAAPARRWPAAVSAGLLAAKWLWRRRAGRWPCLGAALAAGLAALAGHPAVAAAAGAVAAAADLLPTRTD